MTQTKNRDFNILKNYNKEINLNTRVNDSNTDLDYKNIKNLKRELELETLDGIDELNELKKLRDFKYKIDDTDTIDLSIIYDLYK
jgi:hypothetical protein|nr:MAG TPA: hypothetical protein [Caudoviricetes sp.]